jgi:hypothetical protein
VLEELQHADHAGVEVDILPAQTGELAGPHAQDQDK